MTKLFRVALVQKPAVPHDTEKNLKLALSHCREAKKMGADLVLFPEMWSMAYARPASLEKDDIAIWHEDAVEKTSSYVTSLQNIAKELQMGVVATCMSAGDPLPQNTAYLISPTGEILLKYSKVHTCDFDMEGFLAPGDNFPVCEFPFDGGTVKLGVMICYDREFPESARSLMLNGAEIILVPNASDMNPARLNQLSTRAFENMVGVAMANYPGKLHGQSCAYGPVVFTKEGDWVDNTLAMAGHTAETICMAEFDLGELREYRSRECWGNAYRKPQTYGALTKTTVEPPFVRKPRP